MDANNSCVSWKFAKNSLERRKFVKISSNMMYFARYGYLYVHIPCFCRLRTKSVKICARKIRTPTFSSRFPARHAGEYYLFRMVCLWKSLACLCFSVLLIRICFNVDLDPDPGYILCTCQKSSRREYKSHFERLEIKFNFGQFILLLASDPDPDQCGSWFFVNVSTVLYKKILFQDGVGKRGRFIEPHWRNKGNGFKYYLLKLELFFFKVMGEPSFSGLLSIPLAPFFFEEIFATQCKRV
jgi:hypothetical protein